MKILTLFGTRPEIIRLSKVIGVLDVLCDQILVHTGQNYDPGLSDVFFTELGVRQPDVYLGVRAGSFSEQAAQVISRVGSILEAERPDRILILGDTTSGLGAIPAARLQIPVYHMEAGNRCYDKRVPEEVNRRIIDHCSDMLMPYTHRSKENLLREGIERQKIFVVGNPIFEVLESYSLMIDGSSALQRLNVSPRQYFLATLHRAENVDEPARLRNLVDALIMVAEEFGKPVVVSVHPRTADRMAKAHMDVRSDRVLLVEPLGFFDFVKLEKNALCVMSDSGTVQEECCIFRVPNVTLRDVTERPETIECGSNVLTGADPANVLRAVEVATKSGARWNPPSEYLEPRVSATVARIVLGYCSTL